LGDRGSELPHAAKGRNRAHPAAEGPEERAVGTIALAAMGEMDCCSVMVAAAMCQRERDRE
jgi:hypothetical protein